MSNLHSDPDGVIGGAKRADKVANLESVPSGVIGIAKHIDEVDNLESDPGGVGGGAKRAHEVGNLIRSQILTLGQNKKDFTKTTISLEPLDLQRFNTPQIEALCVPDKKNTSGGL